MELTIVPDDIHTLASRLSEAAKLVADRMTGMSALSIATLSTLCAAAFP